MCIWWVGSFFLGLFACSVWQKGVVVVVFYSFVENKRVSFFEELSFSLFSLKGESLFSFCFVDFFLGLSVL